MYFITYLLLKVFSFVNFNFTKLCQCTKIFDIYFFQFVSMLTFILICTYHCLQLFWFLHKFHFVKTGMLQKLINKMNWKITTIWSKKQMKIIFYFSQEVNQDFFFLLCDVSTRNATVKRRFFKFSGQVQTLSHTHTHTQM